MKTVKEVSKLAGVSVRTLHYYDTIGLLKPTEVTGAGYRLYDDAALERLQAILLFRELEFSLKEIKSIMNSSGFDRRKALEQQIKLLELKREHLDNLIDFARGIKAIGVRNLSFKAFDTSRIDEYARKAKEAYGNTAEYKEFQEKDKDRSSAERDELNQGLMDIMAEFGAIKDTDPAETAATSLFILQSRAARNTSSFPKHPLTSTKSQEAPKKASINTTNHRQSSSLRKAKRKSRTNLSKKSPKQPVARPIRLF